MLRKSFVLTGISLLTLALIALSGCNTFKGLGKDIEAGGKAIQDVAE